MEKPEYLLAIRVTAPVDFSDQEAKELIESLIVAAIPWQFKAEVEFWPQHPNGDYLAYEDGVLPFEGKPMGGQGLGLRPDQYPQNDAAVASPAWRPSGHASPGFFSISKAQEKLIKAGICAVDGSGDLDVEALFQRIAIVRKGLEDLRREVADVELEHSRLVAGQVKVKVDYILRWL